MAILAGRRVGRHSHVPRLPHDSVPPCPEPCPETTAYPHLLVGSSPTAPTVPSAPSPPPPPPGAPPGGPPGGGGGGGGGQGVESRPAGRCGIIRNVLTRFNAILGVLFVAVLAVGSPADALFGLVVVWNALIGIVQEVRAKRTLDRLAVLNAPSATVVRDGTDQEVGVGEVVLDDLLRLQTGDQVLADGVVTRATGSRSTSRCSPASRIRSTRRRRAGAVRFDRGRRVGPFQATAVGADSYAQRLAAETKKFRCPKTLGADGRHQHPAALHQLGPGDHRADPPGEPAGARTNSRPTTPWSARSPRSSGWCPRAWCCSRASPSSSAR